MGKNTGGHKNDRLFFGETEIKLLIINKERRFILGCRGQNNEKTSYFFGKFML